MRFKKGALLAILGVITITITGCSKPTAESLKEGIENKEFSTVIKKYNELETTDKTKVDEYITLSIGELMGDYSEGERTEEGKNKIIKEIEELETMEGASDTIKIILESSKEVTNQYYLNQNAFNTAEAFDSSKETLVVYEGLQEACEDDPILLEKVNLRINELNEKLTTPITKGSNIEVGGFDITFNTFEFSYDVLPEVTSGFHTHYEADKGAVYYHVAMDLKNNNKQNIGGDEILKAELVYNDDYKYNGFIVLDATDGSTFDYANITSIKPLETRGVRILFDLPEEIETATESVELYIEIDGQKYVYKAR